MKKDVELRPHPTSKNRKSTFSRNEFIRDAALIFLSYTCIFFFLKGESTRGCWRSVVYNDSSATSGGTSLSRPHSPPTPWGSSSLVQLRARCPGLRVDLIPRAEHFFRFISLSRFWDRNLLPSGFHTSFYIIVWFVFSRVTFTVCVCSSWNRVSRIEKIIR